GYCQKRKILIEITAIGNRVYTDETRLRGLKTFLVRAGGHCLCRREFYSPGISQKCDNTL
ncbi:hypothetical protein, partial [Tychonema sp. BBK16]|nr:hypothetical protein [Tychonema sp. BBK16]